MTDIVLMTCNRLALLKRTLSYLFERTTSPYRLTVIDDASSEGNAEYLQGLWADGRLAGLVLRGPVGPGRESCQYMANWRLAPWLVQSEIFILSDDDILCPKLEPDWLARGLEAMAQYPEIGILAPNCPSRPPAIHDARRLGPLMICDKIGTTLTFVRRSLMLHLVAPTRDGKLGGMAVPANGTHLAVAWARAARALGFEVAYMADVYCQHIGALSARNGDLLNSRMIEPVDGDTLEPATGWRQI